MKQVARLFKRDYLGDSCVADKLNEFLEEHPDYTVDKFSYDNPRGTCAEHLFVVFNIGGNPSGAPMTASEDYAFESGM